MNNLFTQKVLPALSGKREATVKSYENIKNTNGGYLKVTFKLKDRDYGFNIFPGKGEAAGKQINYIASAIRKQLGKESESLSLIEVLDLAKETPISIWFSYNSEFNTMNVAFHESQPTEEIVDLEGVEL